MPRDRTPRAQARRVRSPDALAVPFRPLRNPWPPLDVASPEAIEQIHQTSMRILEEIGIEFLDDEAVGLWERAGATLADDALGGARRVKIDRGLLFQLLSTAPSSLTLHARNPERSTLIGGDHVVFSPVGGPAYTTNLERGRRPGTLADYEDLVKLTQMFSVLHHASDTHVEPADLPVPTRYLTATYRLIALTDKTLMGPARGRVGPGDAVEMAAILFGGREVIAEKPGIITVINVNSPLRYDKAMLGGLITYASAGQPVIVTPFILAGAMAPITIAGAVAQQNAEALAGIAFAQLVHRGAPALYGGFTTDIHMRSGNPSFGTPEGAWATLVGGQLARRYRLPYRTSGGLSSSNAPDAQAAYETMMSLWPALLAHSNFVYQAAGWIEGWLTASYEKFILDVEMLAMMASLLQGFEINDDTLALDFIGQVGPGGHHFDTEHTLARFAHAFYEPLVSTRQGYEAWAASGGPDAAQRAHRKWKELLQAYEQPPLDPAIDDALREFVERRSRELERTPEAELMA